MPLRRLRAARRRRVMLDRRRRRGLDALIGGRTSEARRRTDGLAMAAAALAARSVARLVDQLVLLDPRHHRAQLLADDFDRVLGGQAAARCSVGAPARFSRMKLLAYSPVWMSLQHLASSPACVSSVTIFGPVTYSPYSALFEIE